MSSEPATTPPLVPEYASVRPPRHSGLGFLVIAATFFLPGAGHALAGRVARGLAWLGAMLLLLAVTVACMLITPLLPGLLLLLPLTLALEIATIVDAYRISLQVREPVIRPAALRWLGGVLAIGLAVFLAPAFHLALLIRIHLCEGFTVSSSAMVPTISPVDRFLANKLHTPRRWSIVVFRYPLDREQRFVSRIVALPGETIEIMGGEVLINGKLIPRPAGVPAYTHPPVSADRVVARHTLGPREYFLISDNSGIANDSRLWFDFVEGRPVPGVPEEDIVGTVTATYWPPARWRRLDRP
jgi:signal peptidase I